MDGKATVWFRARGLCRACSRFCRRAKLRSPEICNPQRCRTDGRAGSKCEQAFVPSLSLSDHFKWRRDSPSQDTPGLACSSSGTWHMNQPPVFRPLKRDRRRIGFHQNGILGAGKKTHTDKQMLMQRCVTSHTSGSTRSPKTSLHVRMSTRLERHGSSQVTSSKIPHGG